MPDTADPTRDVLMASYECTVHAGLGDSDRQIDADVHELEMMILGDRASATSSWDAAGRSKAML